MKRTLLAFTFILALSYSSRAQYITIPDSNFVRALRLNGFGPCMVGNTIDTNCAQIYTGNNFGTGYMMGDLRLNNQNISDLTGLGSIIKGIGGGSYVTINLSHNNLDHVPLELTTWGINRYHCHIDLSYNHIDSFMYTHDFDNTFDLILSNNGMHKFYTQDHLVGYGTHILNLNDNNLDSFPTFTPNGGVSYLYVRRNHLRNAPYCNAGNIDIGVNQLSGTLSFGSQALGINCDSNQITTLNIPGGCQNMNCAHNSITMLNYTAGLYPMLTLKCNDNNLTTLPKLPSILTLLDCHNNPNLQCIPSLPNVTNFELDFSNTAITCLPRLFSHCTYTGSPSVSSVPQCNLINNPYGCPQYANMDGYTYIDTSGRCDSTTTGPRMGGIKVQFLDHGTVTQQYYTDLDSGHYSFDEINYGSYKLQIDTTGIPLNVYCPASHYYTATVDSQQLYQTNFNFGLNCKPGFDVGAVSWGSGGFRPGDTSSLIVYAGDMSYIYGLHCAAGISGQVRIIYSGPLRYLGMAAGAVSPSSVNGDTLLWNIADFGSLNVSTAFNILFKTDSSATVFDAGCFDVLVTPASGDNNPANNHLAFCGFVRTSHDPNFKEVYPSGSINTTQQWLTYTIHFQNTGNDTARNVYLLDTLDPAFDPASFQLLHASHKSVTQIGTGGVVQFIFPKINLPDSTTNPTASSGWVQYKVKWRNGLPLGTVINNTSCIYFDLNSAIRTNIARDTLRTFVCANLYTTLYDTICSTGSVTVGAHTYNTAGTTIDTLTTGQGCDSIVTLVLTVYPVLPVSVAVTASKTLFCVTSARDTFTATPVNGGAAPVYQWYKNGVAVGTNSNKYILVTPANNDSIWCTMTSNATCASPATATSNKIGIVIQALVAPTATISATRTVFCNGFSADTFTAVTTNAGASPNYRWYRSGSVLSTAATYITSSNIGNNDSIWLQVTSNAYCVSPVNAYSNRIYMTVTNTPFVYTDVIQTTTTTHCGSGAVDTFTSTPVLLASATPGTVQWYRNNTPVGTNSNTYITSSINSGDHIWLVRSGLNCGVHSTDTSNKLSMFNFPVPPAPVISSNGSTCLGLDTLSIAGAGDPYSIAWSRAGTAVDTEAGYDLINVAAIAFNGGSNGFSMDATGALYVTDAYFGMVTRYPPHSGAGAVGTVVAGGGGAHSALVNPNKAVIGDSGQLYVIDQTLGLVKFPANSVAGTPWKKVTFNTSWLYQAQSICTDTAHHLFTSINYNGQGWNEETVLKYPRGADSFSVPVIAAGLNGPGSAANQLYYPIDICTDVPGYLYVADMYNRRIQKFAPGSVQGSNAVTVAGGNGYGYGLNQFLYPDGVCVDSMGYLYVTDGGTGRIMRYPPNSTPDSMGQLILADGLYPNRGGIRYGNLAVDANGDIYVMCINNLLKYHRKHARTSYVPTATGSYTATYTDQNTGCTSLVSNALTVSNAQTAPSVTITAAHTTITAGAADTFTAVPTNGGAAPSYQWYKNGTTVGANSSTFITNTLANNDSVWCVMTSNSLCANPLTAIGNHVSIIVNAATCTNVFKTLNDTICSGSSVTVGTHTYTTAGTSIDTIVLGNGCDSIVTLNLTVTPSVAASVSVSPWRTSLCSTYTMDTFRATATGGGSAPVYTWYKNGTVIGTNTATLAYMMISNGDSIWCTMTSNATCASPAIAESNKTILTLQTPVTPTVSIAATGTLFCSAITRDTFSIAATTNAGASPTYRWYKNGSVLSTASTYIAPTLANGDSIWLQITSSQYCVSPVNVLSNNIYITSSNTVSYTPTVSCNNTTLCGTATPDTFNATFQVLSPWNSGTIQWYRNSTAVGTNSMQLITSALSSGDSIWMVLSNAPCASRANNQSNVLRVVVQPVPTAPVLTDNGSICTGHDTLSLSGAANPLFIIWYKNGVGIDTEANYQSTIVAGADTTLPLNASFSGSYGMWVDRNGYTYVVDQTNARIQRFPPGSVSGTAGVTVAGGNGTGYATNQLFYPMSVAVDDSGYIYVSDIALGLLKFPPGSNSSSTWTRPGAQIQSHTGPVFVDRHNDVYFINNNGSYVYKMHQNADTNTIPIIMAGFAHQLHSADGIYVDSAGFLYVIGGDYYNSVLRYIPGALGDSGMAIVAGGNGIGNGSNQLAAPQAVYGDSTGNIYVIDISSSGDRILKFPAGSSQATAGEIVVGGSYVRRSWQRFGPYGNTLSIRHSDGICEDQGSKIKKWMSKPISTTFVPASAGSYTAIYVSQSTGCISPPSAPILVDSMAVTPSVTITAARTTITAGAADTFTAVPTNGGAAPSYQWYKNGATVGANSSTFITNTLANNDSVWCVMTSNSLCANPLTAIGNHVSIIVNAATCTNVFKTLNDTICSGSSVTVGIHTYSTAGTSVDTIALAGGCDSIVTLNLTLNSTASPAISINLPFSSFCPGRGNATVFTTNLINAINPDFQWYHNGVPVGFNSPSDTVGGFGLHIDDSLWVVMITHGACIVDTVRSQTFIAYAPELISHSTIIRGGCGCRTVSYIIACRSIDSVVVTSAGAIPPYYTTSLNNSIYGRIITDTFNFTYCSGQTSAYITLASISDSGHCGSSPLNITNLTFVDTIVYTRLPAQTICMGDSFLFGSYYLYSGGSYSDTLSSVLGCDSIVILTLSMTSPVTTPVAHSICAGSSYTFGGRSLTTTGTYLDTITTGGGCDSILVLTLSVINPVTTPLAHSICAGSSYTFGGRTLTTAGTYRDTLTTGGGCDSIITLTLSVNNILASSVSAHSCTGSPYVFGTRSITAPGIYYDTLTAGTGCDSIVTLTLAFYPLYRQNLTDSICVGSTYVFGSQVLSAAGTYYDTLHSMHGCDSVIVLHLTVNPLPTKPTITHSGNLLTSSAAAHYQWLRNGTVMAGSTSGSITVSQNGGYAVEVTDANGCSNTSDTVLFVHLSIDGVSADSYIRLYPNPNSGSFTLETSAQIGEEYAVYDMLGQIIQQHVISADIQRIDMGDVAAGVYSLVVRGKNGSVRFTVMR